MRWVIVRAADWSEIRILPFRAGARDGENWKVLDADYAGSIEEAARYAQVLMLQYHGHRAIPGGVAPRLPN